MKHINTILLVLVAAIGSLVYVFNDRSEAVESYSGELLSLKVPQQQEVKEEKNEITLLPEGMGTVLQPTMVYAGEPAGGKGVESTIAGFPIAMYQGEEREIGYDPEQGMHHPSEEVFQLYIDSLPGEGSLVYLDYELYGVADYTHVGRSINQQPVFGGCFIKRWDTWTRQSERINPSLLHKGLNVIRFTIPQEATYRYKIRNLKIDIHSAENLINNSEEQEKNHSIEIRNEKSTGRSLVVNQPTTAFYYKQYGYLQGFVSGKDAEKAKLSIGNRKVRSYQGEFEGIAMRPTDKENLDDANVVYSDQPWSTVVEAVFPDGEVLRAEVVFERPSVWDYETGFNPDIHYTEKEISTEEAFCVFLDEVSLEGKAGTIEDEMTLSITALRSIDIPRLNPGMVNVTSGGDAYRFLPHGTHFKEAVNLRIGYDTAKIPKGHSAKEIRSYYYDEGQRYWVALPRDSVSGAGGVVCSKTTHFTDIINAIVKVPEMPEAKEFTPTSIKELKAADPSSGIQMIQAPTANSQGTANVSYPIQVPAGRQGLQPNLSVNYSSEGGNGLLGMGWDMQIPAITVDTKWGVPRYDATNETEGYLLNGEELLPNPRHVSTWESRNISGTKQFYPRIEGAFDSIVRYGNSPNEYFWIVTNKRGIKSYYGSYDGQQPAYDVLLKKPTDGSIAQWPLCKVEDLNGNFMKYYYTISEQYENRRDDDNQEPYTIKLGKQLWLDSITYTGYSNNDGAYKVAFYSDDYPICSQLQKTSVVSEVDELINKSNSGTSNSEKRELQDSIISDNIGISGAGGGIGLLSGGMDSAYVRFALIHGFDTTDILYSSYRMLFYDSAQSTRLHVSFANDGYYSINAVVNRWYFVDALYLGDSSYLHVNYYFRVFDTLSNQVIQVIPFFQSNSLIIRNIPSDFVIFMPEQTIRMCFANYYTDTANKIPYQKMKLYEYDTNHSLVLLNYFETDINGLYDTLLIPDRTYRLTKSRNSSDPCSDSVEFDFRVSWDEYNYIYDTIVITSEVNTTGLVKRLYNDTNTGAIYLPLHDKPSQLNTYSVFLDCYLFNGLILNNVAFELSSDGVPIDTFETINNNSIELQLNYYKNYHLRQLEYIPIYQDPTKDELAEMDIRVDFACPRTYLLVENTTNQGHEIISNPYSNIIGIRYTPAPEIYSLRVISASTGDSLPGAVFELYKKVSNNFLYVQTYTTDNTGCIPELNLPVDATYYLIQIKAPEGYITDNITEATMRIALDRTVSDIDTSVNLSIDTIAKVITVINSLDSMMVDTGMVTVRLKIVDESNNNKGVVNYPFQVIDAVTGNFLGIYKTDTNGYTSVFQIKKDQHYNIKEVNIQSPNSKIQSSDTIHFYIRFYTSLNYFYVSPNAPSGWTCDHTPNTSLYTVTLKKPKRTRLVRIRKISPENEYLGLENAGFLFCDLEADTCKQFITNSLGYTDTFRFSTCSRYSILETQAPVGYEINSYPLYATMDNAFNISILPHPKYNGPYIDAPYTYIDSRAAYFQVKDSKLGPRIRVKAIDVDDNSLLTDAGVKIYQFPDTIESMSLIRTDDNALSHVIPLKNGYKYRIVEYDIPEGYSARKRPFFDIEVDNSGNIIILDSCQLSDNCYKINNVWIYTLLNKKQSLYPDLGSSAIYDDCRETYPYDNTINARYGFRQSSKEKLRKIIIYYKDSCVRSYSFCYATDAFGRAQLQKIEQWGVNYSEEGAYVHELEYYDNIRESENFTYLDDEELWNQYESNLFLDYILNWNNKLTNFLMTNEFARPTLLGGAQSLSIGGGGGVNVGLGFKVMDKEATIGYGGSGYGSWGNGRTTLLDMDGDGLPDQVFSFGKMVFYCPQIADSAKFGIPIEIPKLTHFLREKTTGFSHGPQISIGCHASLEWSRSTSKTKIYLSDINGDGFVDVVENGKFKSLGRVITPPLLTANDCTLPIIEQNVDTLKAECLEISGIQNIPIEDRDSIIDTLSYDVVRVWNAEVGIEHGVVHQIFAPVYLAEDTARVDDFYGEEDAVIVSIETGGYMLWDSLKGFPKYTQQLLWIDTLYAGDTMIHCESLSWGKFGDPNTPNIKLKPMYCDVELLDFLYFPVFKEGNLFFRTRPLKNGVKSKVIWDPQIFNNIPTLNGDFSYDANGLLIANAEKASRSQLCYGDSNFYCPLSGTLHIKYNQTLPPLSDIVNYSIYYNNSLLVTHSSTNGQLYYDNTLHVTEGDSIQFVVNSASNVDLVSAQWQPYIYYDSITIPKDSILDTTIYAIQNGRSLLDFYPTPYYTFYSDIVSFKPFVHTFPISSLTLQPGISIYSGDTLNGNIHFVIKKRSQTIFSHTYNFNNQLESYRDPLLYNLTIDLGDTLYFECYLSDKSQKNKIKECYILVNGIPCYCIVYAKKDQHPVFGNFYNGWSQFLYKNDQLSKMNPNKINWLINAKNNHIFSVDVVLDTSGFNGSLDSLLTLAEETSSAQLSQLNKFLWAFPMFPNNEKVGHRGVFENTSILGADIRLGNIPYYEDEEVIDELCGEEEYENAQTNDLQKSEILTQNSKSGSDEKDLLDKVSKSKAISFSVGCEIGGFGFGLSGSRGESWLKNDIMDLNGDGIPDIIKSGLVQYSKPQGGWSTGISVFSQENHYQATNYTVGSNFLGTQEDVKEKVSNSGKGTKYVAGGSNSICVESVDYMLLDINGDGLPDRIYDGGEVQLNLGYGFEEEKEYWGVYMEKIGRSLSVSVSGDAGGFSVWKTSFGGGINITSADNQSLITFADVNGDGLPDLITNTYPLKVRLNTGCGFINDNIVWEADMPLTTWQHAFSNAINFNATFGFTIFSILKCEVNPRLYASQNLTNTSISLDDVDGDGYADLLISDTEDEMKVKRSNIGKSGLLKAVTNPLGGRFEIDYKKTKATPTHPRRWVMESVKVYDGLSGDGVNISKTTYCYDTGYYDRREKAFYGFAKITEYHHQTDNNDAVYRKITHYYRNDSIYTQGILVAEMVQDAMGNKYIYSKNTYDFQRPVYGNESPEILSKFPALREVLTCYYEGQSNPPINQTQTFTYGAYGNITQQTEVSTSMSPVTVSITYHPQQNGNYCVGIPGSVEVSGYRKRTTQIDNKGRFTDIDDYYNSNNYLRTHMEYDNYGNCIQIVYPNHSYSYVYDSEVYTYPISVTDIFGHASNAQDYDFRFGVPRTLIDKYGSHMEYTLDQWGRVLTITGQKEIDVSQPYTIRYVYNRAVFDNSGNMLQPASTHTYNFDPEYPSNDIEIYTYADGLGRIVQTKKDADVNGVEKKVISGRIIYDAFGRAIANYYPTVQALGDTTYYTGVDGVSPSTTQYDILDRPVQQVAPDQSVQTFVYGFGQDAIGHTLFKTTVIDQRGHPSILLKDVNDLQWALKPAGEPYVYFAYDIIGQCDSVYSSQPNDFSRKYTYDMLGRKTSYTEGFLSENYTYTGTNLTWKSINWFNSITGGPDNKSIGYAYTHNRLESMYSTEYNAPTEYVYDDQNSHGRLVAIKDESGLQAFEYGNMGEITKSTRAYALPTQAQPIALSTEFTYDSWGRMQQIVYPDGEILDYSYDKGGQLKSMSGTKGGFNYSYITDMRYDEFGAKIYMEYGNQVTTAYSYSSLTRRLMNITASYQSNPYYSMGYTYDAKGNITQLLSFYEWLPGEIITQEFTYDSTDQLITAEGNTQNYDIYSNAIDYGNWGKVLQYDIQITDPLTSLQTERQTTFNYPSSNNNRTQTLFGAENSHTYQPYDNPPDLDIEYDFGINGSLRRKQSGEYSEYYLFNAFNSMKAYSYNGERFGYYGYDASGERTYKYGLDRIDITTNQGDVYVTETYWEANEMMFYPNGYINMNQNGEYTKHYYADALRIASKIGSGKSGLDLCSEAMAIENAYPGYLTDRINEQYEQMKEELWELVPGSEYIVDITPIPYPNFCDIGPGGQESALFFYHPDHLGSTGMVTDNSANITQGFLYTPFGEIISDYSPTFHDSPMPNYAFNAKELDEENGMYYYSARYYAPPTFISRDPMFEKYSSISPYTYCANNPVMFVDPDGKRPRPYGLLFYYGLTLGGVSNLGESQIIGGYNVVPFYDNNGILLGYNAGRYIHNGQDYRTEYQMGPGDLADFTNNVEAYEAIANLIYCAGEPNWSSIAMIDKMISGDLVGAFGELENQWANALSDPSFYLSLATSIAGTGNNLPKQLTPSQLKSINSLQKQIKTHQSKLAAYKKNPMKFDNNSYLKNAPNEAARQRIIQSRIKHLEKEIQTFKGNIIKILNGE